MGPTAPPAAPAVPEPGAAVGPLTETVDGRSLGVQVVGGPTAGFGLGP